MSKRTRESGIIACLVVFGVAAPIFFGFLTRAVASPVEMVRKVPAICKYVAVGSSATNVSVWPDPTVASHVIRITDVLAGSTGATATTLTFETINGSPVTIFKMQVPASNSAGHTFASPMAVPVGEGIQVDNSAAIAVELVVCGWEEQG